MRPRKNIKALSEELEEEKLLVTQKDKQLVAANQKVKSVATKAVHAF